MISNADVGASTSARKSGDTERLEQMAPHVRSVKDTYNLPEDGVVKLMQALAKVSRVQSDALVTPASAEETAEWDCGQRRPVAGIGDRR